jgi:hypothetical protein
MVSIVKGLLGKKPRGAKVLQGYKPAGFTSAGLSGSFDGNNFSVSQSPGLRAAIDDIRAGFSARAQSLQTQASAVEALRPTLTGIASNLRSGIDAARGSLATSRTDLATLRPELDALRGRLRGTNTGLPALAGQAAALRSDVRPGFGRATESRVTALRAQQQQAVGNLREELSRRRVLGSSFASREVSALNADFAMQEDRIRADAFIDELTASGQLLELEAGIAGQEAAIGLELNSQERALIGDAFSIVRTSIETAMQEAALAQGLSQQEAALFAQDAALVTQAFQARAESTTAAISSALAVLQQLNLETGIAAEMARSSSQLSLQSLLGQAEAFSAQDNQLTGLIASITGDAASFFGKILGGP